MTDRHLTRRGFLAATAVAAAPLALQGRAEPRRATADACLFIVLNGGPSQLDSFDPKPDAPAEVRGPFAAIPTAVPGVAFTELLPRLAANFHRFALIRSLSHDAPAVHEAGLQLLSTGRFTGHAPAAANLGSLLGVPWQLVPGRPLDWGISADCGLAGGQPLAPRDDSFAGRCRAALSALEAGGKLAVVHHSPGRHDGPTWDAHADLTGQTRRVAADFDRTFAAVLEYLAESGRLARTLVVAAGEFGRTPRVNGCGGRDHWPRCGVALLAGGGVRGGRIVGASDASGGEARERPVHPAELLATVMRATGAGSPLGVEAVTELF